MSDKYKIYTRQTDSGVLPQHFTILSATIYGHLCARHCVRFCIQVTIFNPHFALSTIYRGSHQVACLSSRNHKVTDSNPGVLHSLYDEPLTAGSFLGFPDYLMCTLLFIHPVHPIYKLENGSS